jgi:uncharacterized protein (TIGR03435 family)
MPRLPHPVHLVFVAALSAFGQAQAQPTFEVASIRPATERVEFERDGQIAALHGTLRMRGVSVSACVAFAYGISTSQVLGPASLTDKRYDIIAKAEPNTPETQLRQMLQSLLAERFHLTLHHGQKEMRGYVLTVFANPPRDPAKFHPSAAEGEFYRQNSATGTVARNITMQQFAEFLSSPLEGPVADQTDLPGHYDLQLEFARYVDLTPTDQSALPGVAYVLNAALKGELGLQITPRRTNFEVVVVDHVEYPSPN